MLARECRSAANRTFTNNGATVDSAPGGDTVFRDNSTAGSATLIANGGTNGGLGGTIRFEDNSNGGKSRVMVSGNGTLDVSNHNSGLFTIGSIEGDGRVSLGDGLIFQIGANDQNSTFSGDIAGRNPSIDPEKVGTGRLTLSGNTDVGGDAEIFGGVLQVDGSFGSVNTFVHQGSTLAGSGSVQTGIVQVGSGGKVRPGSADAPGVLTVSGNYAQDDLATLAIQIAGADEFSKLDVSGNAFLSGTLEPVLLNDFIPAVGDTFAFLFYHDHDGEFSTIANENFFGNLHWVVDYDTDPTMAILTVVSGPAPIPDHGSTFLFLTLGLLGLVTYRRQLLRRQT